MKPNGKSVAQLSQELYAAAESGNLHAAVKALAYGADVGWKNVAASSQTPLHRAAAKGRVSVHSSPRALPSTSPVVPLIIITSC